MKPPRVKSVGIRIQNYRLSRYRKPERVSDRARLTLTLALAGWLIWALFLSDHSAVRLLALGDRRAETERELARVQGQVTAADQELESAGRAEVSARVLRERHNFAREGEMLYVIQGDEAATPAAGDSSGR